MKRDRYLPCKRRNIPRADKNGHEGERREEAGHPGRVGVFLALVENETSDHGPNRRGGATVADSPGGRLSGTGRVEDGRRDAAKIRDFAVSHRETRDTHGHLWARRKATPGVGGRRWRHDRRQRRNLVSRTTRAGAGPRGRPGLVVRAWNGIADVVAACSAQLGGRQTISQQQGHYQPHSIPHQTLYIGLLHGFR